MTVNCWLKIGFLKFLFRKFEMSKALRINSKEQIENYVTYFPLIFNSKCFLIFLEIEVLRLRNVDTLFLPYSLCKTFFYFVTFNNTLYFSKGNIGTYRATNYKWDSGNVSEKNLKIIMNNKEGSGYV